MWPGEQKGRRNGMALLRPFCSCPARAARNIHLGQLATQASDRVLRAGQFSKKEKSFPV